MGFVFYPIPLQEEKELQEKLDQIDKENQEKLENESTLSHGLIDTFYSKDTTIGTILTPLLPTTKSEGSPKSVSSVSTRRISSVSTINSSVSTRRICECDDPDCKGYIEDEVENSENNIGIKREEVVFAPDSNEVNNDANLHYSSDENLDSDNELETKRKQEEGKKIVDIDFFAPEKLDVKSSKKRKPSRVNEPVGNVQTLVKVKKEDLYDDNEPETTLSNNKVKERKKKRKKDSDRESLEVSREKDSGMESPEVSRKKLKLDTKLSAEMIQDEEAKSGKPVTKFTSSSTADIQSTMGASSVKKRVAHSSEEVNKTFTRFL